MVVRLALHENSRRCLLNCSFDLVSKLAVDCMMHSHRYQLYAVASHDDYIEADLADLENRILAQNAYDGEVSRAVVEGRANQTKPVSARDVAGNQFQRRSLSVVLDKPAQLAKHMGHLTLVYTLVLDQDLHPNRFRVAVSFDLHDYSGFGLRRRADVETNSHDQAESVEEIYPCFQYFVSNDYCCCYHIR